MKIIRIVQAVALMLIVALAASCAAGKEYAGKLFTPHEPARKDSGVAALRFLELDSLQTEKEGWVSTDIIMDRDTAGKTTALDKLARIFPVVPVAADSALKNEPARTNPVVIAEAKPVQADSEPVAKAAIPGEMRNKRIRDK